MNQNSELKPGLTRRHFLQLAGLSGAAFALRPALTIAAEVKPAIVVPEVWVIRDADPAKLMRAGLAIIEKNGGLGLGKKINKLALKVNAAWAREPEVGANTNPALVDAFLAYCKAQGIAEVVLPEKPCASAHDAFKMSGIGAAAAKNGCKLYALDKDSLFREVLIPDGKKIKNAKVGIDFLDADVVINMPVAKHHGGAKLTICMKNWMGAVDDRGFWHRNDLHQCIADFSSFMKPTWGIVDLTRIMLSRGPQGPSDKMKYPESIVICRNQVSADAVAATYFVDDPSTIPYLKIANEMGLGVIDPGQMKIHRLEAATILA